MTMETGYTVRESCYWILPTRRRSTLVQNRLDDFEVFDLDSVWKGPRRHDVKWDLQSVVRAFVGRARSLPEIPILLVGSARSWDALCPVMREMVEKVARPLD